jgi:hypothetical protein
MCLADALGYKLADHDREVGDRRYDQASSGVRGGWPGYT